MLYGENQDAVSTTTACTMLAEILNGIKGRSVLVELRPKARKATGAGGDMRTGFFDLIVDISDSLPANERGAGGYGGPGLNGIEEILKREQQINELKIAAIRAEQEQTKASPFIRIAEKFAENDKLINMIGDKLLNALMPKPQKPTIKAALAGNEREEINNTLERLKGLDPEYVVTLKNLADYLEQNPGMLDGVKQIITPQ